MPLEPRLDAPVAPGYDPVARALHWLIAGLAVIVVTLGWAIHGVPRETDSRELLLLLHRSLGVSIVALMLGRALWRLGHPPPPFPPSLARIERLAAHGNHLLLYVFFVVLPVSGYVNAAAAGHPVSLFGIVAIPPLVPEDGRLSLLANAVHLVGQFVVYALVLVHVAAALMHALIRRDGIFDRMLPRRRVS
ncbi:MAG TPA: cytochrome b [Stellaceae bacterium]|nr:cytochrome b [Stellaceae bacterium]